MGVIKSLIKGFSYCSSLLCLALHSQAQESLFIPDNLEFYNPLAHSQGQRSNALPSTGYDNQDLVWAARELRTSSLSASQRALNHQWLEHHSEDSDIDVSKALSRMLRLGVKTYWQGIKNTTFKDNDLVPDGNGQAKVSSQLGYKVRLNDSRLHLKLDYQF